ncbi:ABC transporter permease [Mycobacterium spongiae]|nr:ATP-binding cassette domain-containing protein [Mycobacterium spongiae]
MYRDATGQYLPDVLLRFTSAGWMAIDSGHTGIFVDGARVSTVDIRDGQAIIVGDPQRGPRLIFQLTTPMGPTDRPTHQPGAAAYPPPAPPHPGQPTQPLRAETAAGAMPASPLERTTSPMKLPPSSAGAAQRPPREPVRPESRGPAERAAEVTQQSPSAHPDTASGEVASPTSRLPLKSGARTIGVAAYQLGLSVDGHTVLSDVSFTARPGSMIAVIGPSATRNASLLGLVGATRPASSGVLTVDGHDVGAEPEWMRSRIGVVPRDDRVHPHLTVEGAVEFAAELRLPPDSSPDDRRRLVDQVIDELELTEHRTTRIAKLGPETRRCASMAVELITRPSLLVVDQPRAGSDPGHEAHVMATLRRQADLGCVVVMTTSSLAHLDMCDQVLVLTADGTVAFAGPPKDVESAMGTAHWPGVLERVAADPEGAHRAFLRRRPATPAAPAVADPEPAPIELTLGQQIWLVARRQARLLVGDRPYCLFLAVLPFALAAMTLLIPGDSGLARADPSGTNPHEPVEILAALNIAAVIIGFALTIRDLVGERRIFRREQSVGLSATAYLAGKVIVFSVAAAVQTAILTTIVIAVKGGPARGAVLLHNPAVELYVSVAATAIVSAVVGLALSSLGTSLREVLPLLVPAILASLLFAGGLIGLVGTWGFDQISWLIPAQWGFAASASTVDMRRVESLTTDVAPWTHYWGWWMFDMIILLGLGALWAGFVRYRLRRPWVRNCYR